MGCSWQQLVPLRAQFSCFYCVNLCQTVNFMVDIPPLVYLLVLSKTGMPGEDQAFNLYCCE